MNYANDVRPPRSARANGPLGIGRHARGRVVNVQQAHRFVPAGGGFDVEHAGPVIRIWCGVCDKHDHLSQDDKATVERWKAVHRCGDRISRWECGDAGVRS